VAYAALQLGVGAVLAGLCLLGRRVGWSRQQLVNVALGLSCCWMLVLGPATEGVTYLFLAAPLAWALVEVFGKRRSWPARTTILAAAGCLLTAFVAVWFPSGKRLHQLGLHPLAGLLTFAYLFADALQRTWRPIDARRTVILTRSESLPDRQAAG
jgi:hypothetical protein